MVAYLPDQEPRATLYDILPEYPLRHSKMLRSTLCLAACAASGGAIEEALDTAAAIELLHNAFLIHDDIEDGSEQRRGGQTLHVRHGIPLAINAGDALSLLSFRPLLRNVDRFGSRLSLQILTEMHRVAEQTVEGQAIELGWRLEVERTITPAQYLQMTLKKTCWYTTILPCRAGAMIAARRPLERGFAVDFGFFLGAVFQIQDDLLTVVGGSEQHGKSVGEDIYEGKRTLLLIHLLGVLDGAERRRLLRLLTLPREEREPDEVRWVIEQMHVRGSVDYARSCACTMAGAALHEFEQTFG